MDPREFVASVRRLLKITTKPSRKEALTLIRVSLIGVALVGAIGFMIKVLFWIVGLAPSP